MNGLDENELDKWIEGYYEKGDQDAETLRDEPDDRADDFRCPGCELNTGDGRLCWRCRMEENSRTGSWCQECETRTNHTTVQHQEAEQRLDEYCRHCDDYHSPSYECKGC